MNPDQDVNNDSAKTREMIERACRDFESAFSSDPEFRIERMLKNVRSIFQSLESENGYSDSLREILGELIFVEMDMRHAAGQSFDAEEYHIRFPDFETVVEQSIQRVRKLHKDFREDVSVVTITESSRGVHGDDLGFELDLEREQEVPTKLGPFREIAEINSGGFGIICRAVDSRNGQAVALKFPRKDKLTDDVLLGMFLEEAGKAFELDHPGIVRTFGLEQSNGYLAIVQQLIEGSDLKKTKAQIRTRQEIAELVAQVADALAYAHRQGIYHRDLKPGNILIDQESRPYIADFGLALHEREQIYLPKQRCGTAPYMSPEQAAGLTQRLDGRSDIWSLGVILYELLAGRRPFQGVTNSDLYDQIENNDPRPLRQMDLTIDRELQRICLKCLERQQRDRYLTADELADDLRHWIGRSADPKPTDQPVQFIPRGLRSYSVDDAGFFLDLLPGPRDRNGIPGSILFWKSRICEPVAAENRVPIGVIYGPSGSGKSSFVKAGLLPQVNSHVQTIYVEATQDDTEVRLIKALRQCYPDIPDEISLPDLFFGLRNGNWIHDQRKPLIVLDQFEQRLSLADDFAKSQIFKGLRQCDGENLQCLLLVRDDFWMAMTRFADALEMDLREGENSHAIDLFDRSHARKVLIKLGQAYERLPSETQQLSDDENAFLDEAVSQLSDHGYVICVRLTLFAEMFRHRPWTIGELKSVHGVSGTGQEFLEATFGSASPNQRYRRQRDAVAKVLEALLPASGSDIRGAMKSGQELIAAAYLDQSPDQFADLVKTLDTDLRLITPTDPDVSGELDSSAAGEKHKSWYQLTHDYLVPSIRGWLEVKYGKTRAGRAKLRLRDLGAQVTTGQKPRNLPTNLEWMAWKFLIPADSLTDNGRLVMHCAGRRFLQQAGIAASILLVLGLLGVWVASQNAYQQRVKHVDGLINDLIGQEVSVTPEIVAELLEYQALAEPRLRKLIDGNGSPECDRLRVAMGLLPFDSRYSSTLIAATTNADCKPEELVALTRILVRYDSTEFTETLHTTLDETGTDPQSRFRALAALVLQENHRDDWSQYAGMLAKVLWNEPITSVDPWIEILKPIGTQLTPTFSTMFASAEDAKKATVLAKALFDFLPYEERMSRLAYFIPDATEIRFDAVLSVIESNATGETFADSLEQLSIDDDNVANVNVSLALMRMGREQSLMELYSGEFDTAATVLAINLSTPGRIRLHGLRELYNKFSLSDSDNVNLRRSFLQAMAFHSIDLFDPGLDEWLTNVAHRHVLSDRDACCFSTSELILRRLGMDSTDQGKWRSQRRENSTDGILGNVFVDPRLMAFSVFDGTTETGPVGRFAISTTETTYEDLQDFPQLYGNEMPLDRPNHPFEVVNFSRVYHFCNWLSKANGLLTDDFCYPETIEEFTIPADTNRIGYRIPTVLEWEIANQSNKVLEGLAVHGNSLATNYAWVFENSDKEKLEAVAGLLPNAAGLFDSFGNVQEVCQAMEGKILEFYEKGQTIRADSTALMVNYSRFCYVAAEGKSYQGIRLVRRLK